LADTLSHSTFDPSQLSFFSWLGVTYYLPKEAVLTSLRKIRAIVSSGSNIVFDYMDADSFPPKKWPGAWY
jgi:O-methyltransferase involved in polyketide biosynthesis